VKRALLRGTAIASIATPLALAFATPFASIFLIGTLAVTRLADVSRIQLTKVPYVWWLYAYWYGSDARFTTKLAVCATIPLTFIGLAVGVGLFRRRRRRVGPARVGQPSIEPERAASRIHGNASWMAMEEAMTLFPGPHPVWGGIPVGEAYRPDLDPTKRDFVENDPETWGQGGKSPLLMTPLTSGAISGIIIGGSGSFKTMAFVVTSMCTWRGSAVVLDPSTQVGPMVAGLRRAMGQHVALVDPRASTGSFNVLGCIDLDDPLAIVHLIEFIDWCLPEQDTGNDDKNGKFFAMTAREVPVAVLADLLWDTDLPRWQRTVKEWRRRLTIPEEQMKQSLVDIYANSKSDYARQLAGTVMRTFKETWSSIYKHITVETNWLSVPAFADMLSGDSFDPFDLIRGRLTVLLQIPDDVMKATPAVARVVIGALARIVLRAEGKVTTPIPFILDEVDLLQHMPILATLRDLGRKSGAALFPAWQSTGQLQATWGLDGKRSWYASAAWRMYAAVNDQETAEEVSARCGTFTVLARTEGSSTSVQGMSIGAGRTRGSNDNTSEQPHPLISPYDVQTALRPDEAIIIPRGRRALRCGRSLYWRRPEMADIVSTDRYLREEAVT
jgi:type IV secretion system protein VirD4